MGRLRLLALLLLVFNISCTRDVPEKLSLSLSVPSVIGGLSVQPMRLGLIVVNMRPAGGAGAPSVFKANGDQFGFVGPGGNVNIVIPGFQVPRDPALLVQYFGVFESEDAGMQFSYGSTTVNSSTNGPIPAHIVANVFGNASRRANVYGRYDFAATDYRNGTVLMEFINTGGDPAVEISASDMINGYFNTIAVDSAGAIRHTFFNDDGSDSPTGTPIFGGDTSVTLMNSFAVDAQVAKIDIPIRTKKEIHGFGSVNFEPRLNPPQDVFVGYFNGAGNCVEYPASGSDVYLSNTYAPDLTTPIQFKGAGGTISTHVMVTAGGQGSPCAGTPYVTDFKINPRWTSEDNIEPHGVAAPFIALGDFDEEPVYARARVVEFSTNPQIKLRWKYLPGLVAANVGGAEVYIKYSPNSGGGGGGDKEVPCNFALESQGYQFLANVPGVGPNMSYDVDNNAAGANFSWDYNNPNYFRNFKFAICPHRDVLGVKANYGMYAEIHDVDEVREVNPMSFGDGSLADSNPAISAAFASWGERVDSLGPVNDDVTRVFLSSAAETPNVGDEVYFYVAARGVNSGSCGYLNGHNDPMYEIGAGMHHHARVQATGITGNRWIEIRSGSWVDQLANLNGAATGATFCYVTAQNVKHYENLSFSGSGEITATVFDLNSTAQAGMILIRVANQLTLGGSSGAFFNADGGGYRGGFSADESGQGEGGSSLLGDNITGGIGASTQAGGGGGGLMDGGDGGNHADSMGAGIGADNMNPGPYPFMGGGGASGDGGTGGDGGGLILLSARAIHFQAGDVIATANATAGSAGSATGSGGGGGGSINIVTERLTRSAAQNLDIYANGGAGGAAGTDGGGGGGAGSIRLIACDYWNEAGNPLMTRTFQAIGGAGGAAGTAGLPGIAANPLGLFLPGPGCVPEP